MKITVKEFIKDVMKDYNKDDIVLKFEVIIKRERSISVRCYPNFPSYEELESASKHRPTNA